MKITVPHKVYTFQQKHISDGDISGFLNNNDPLKMNDQELARMGSLIIRFEKCPAKEIPLHLPIRNLVRKVYFDWPWAGYFLNLEKPLGTNFGINQFPLCAFGLCLADIKMLTWEKEDTGRIELGPQFHDFVARSHYVIQMLGEQAGLKSEIVKARHVSVAAQFKRILE